MKNDFPPVVLLDPDPTRATRSLPADAALIYVAGVAL